MRGGGGVYKRTAFSHSVIRGRRCGMFSNLERERNRFRFITVTCTLTHIIISDFTAIRNNMYNVNNIIILMPRRTNAFNGTVVKISL